MVVTPSVNAIQQVEAQVKDAAHPFATPPLTTPRTATSTTPRDTVELSAEAVVLLISRNAVSANIEVIKTENGVHQAQLIRVK